MGNFDPKTAVITGGASGIGFAVAKNLAAKGIKVILADLPGKKLEKAKENIGGVLAYPCDVADLEQSERLAEFSFDTLGVVHLVLNNAGVGGVHGKMWEVDPEDARNHLNTNFWGVWHGCKAFVPKLIAQKDSSAIYNTGSENSFFCGVQRSAAYIAAKHAVLGLTESLRDDLPEHVHAGLIIPGWVHTSLGNAKFMQFGMSADKYAKIITPQLLEKRRFVVSHGYNTVRINERMSELNESYDQFALNPEEDAKHDVRLFMEKIKKERRG